MTEQAFGIDIGGSGIKGAPVDLRSGALAADRLRIPTPQPSEPEAVADTVSELIDSFEVDRGMPVGVTFPAVIQQGVARTAANVDKSWIGTDVDALFTERTGHDVFVVNDADAAGIAEMEFGAGRGQKGVVLMVTLGTGVGSAMFVDGRLVPNSELGHIPLKGDAAEKYMAESVRERKDLSWKKWAKRLQKYFSLVEFLFSPNLIIVGGGVSKEHEKFLPRLDLNTPIVPAELRNEAGIIGAAALARRSEEDGAGSGPTSSDQQTSSTSTASSGKQAAPKTSSKQASSKTSSKQASSKTSPKQASSTTSGQKASGQKKGSGSTASTRKQSSAQKKDSSSTATAREQASAQKKDSSSTASTRKQSSAQKKDSSSTATGQKKAAAASKSSSSKGSARSSNSTSSSASGAKGSGSRKTSARTSNSGGKQAS